MPKKNEDGRQNNVQIIDNKEGKFSQKNVHFGNKINEETFARKILPLLPWALVFLIVVLLAVGKLNPQALRELRGFLPGAGAGTPHH